MTQPSTTQDEPSTVGAVERLATDDLERKRFLKMTGKRLGAGVAASSLAAFIAACGSSSKTTTSTAATSSAAPTSTSSSASSSSAPAADTGDLAIVNYALTLEYLESQFYAKVISSGLFKGTDLSVIKTFGAEESAHVAALHKVASSLGKPAAEPTGKFPIHSAAQVTTLAGAVENLGASAYLGQAPRIKSPEILAAALAIHSIEARHAATINLILKKSPTPDGAFAKPMSMSQVLAAVKPFIA